MTKYHTADGEKFFCLGFKSQGQDTPVVGYCIFLDGDESSDSYNPDQLTLWREPAKPEQAEVWEVVCQHPDGEITAFYADNKAACEAFKSRSPDRVITIRLKETITVGGV